jgi:uncharacterized membrane protein YdbT with pleckstrin-like domain
MPFPPKLLNEGEKIVLDIHPHWFFFFGPMVAAIIVLVVAVPIAASLGQTWFWWLLALGVLVVAGWGLVRFLKWRTMNFVITSDRVIYRSGIFAKSGIQIPLERVNNVIFKQNFWERVVGAGDLVIESAGESGRQVFEDVRHPDHVQKLILAEMDKAEDDRIDRMRTPLSPGPLSSTEQLEKLEGMLQRGTINQAEFDAQKRRLLGDLPPPPPPPPGAS